MTITDNIGYPSHYDDSAERTLGLPSWFDLGNVGWGAQGEPVAADAVLAALDWEAFYAATGRAVPSPSANILRDLAAASLIRLRPLGRWSVTALLVTSWHPSGSGRKRFASFGTRARTQQLSLAMSGFAKAMCGACRLQSLSLSNSLGTRATGLRSNPRVRGHQQPSCVT
jgi:hypothetical protein